MVSQDKCLTTEAVSIVFPFGKPLGDFFGLNENSGITLELALILDENIIHFGVIPNKCLTNIISMNKSC